MAYLSDNNPNTAYGLIPGDSRPVQLNYLNPETAGGFLQTPLVQGSLTDTPYSLNPNYYSFAGNNGIGTGWGGIQDFPIINLQPPSTIFNLDIPGDSGGGGTSFADVLASTSDISIGGTNVSNFMTVSKSPGSAGPSVRGTYTVDINATNFIAAVQAAENNPTTAAIQTFQDQGSGSFTASSTDNSIRVSGDYTGSSGYIKTDVDNGGNMDVTFERFMFERFGDGTTNLTPTSQNQLLTFTAETDSNLSVTASGSTFTFDEVVAPLSYSAIQTDDGNVDAESLNSTVKFTNTSTKNAVKAVLNITGSDTTDGVDEVRFAMTPNARVGFGAHLCIIGNSDPTDGTIQIVYEGFAQVVRYRVYECYVVTWDPDSPYSDSTSSGELWDFSLNSFNFNNEIGRATPACGAAAQGTSPLVEDLIDPSSAVTKFTYADFKCGEVVLAQNIRPGVWAMGMASNMKAFCQ